MVARVGVRAQSVVTRVCYRVGDVLEQAQLHAALDGVVQLHHVPARERAPHLLHRVVCEGAWVGGSRPPMEYPLQTPALPYRTRLRRHVGYYTRPRVMLYMISYPAPSHDV